jgi:hypothetical protein
MSKALFEGLISDENGNAVTVAYVGDEPTYVVVEDGFRYHVDARRVDSAVLDIFRDQVRQNEDLVSDGVMRMMGKDDLFTRAAVINTMKNLDKNFAQLFETGIPEEARQYLGMLGFSVTINRQGDVIHLNMPSAGIDDGER